MLTATEALDKFVRSLGPQGKAELDKLIATELSQPWLPTPGPQLDAYLSKADLLLYGGAAGGGKSDLLLGCALTQHERSVIFRPQAVDLRGLEDRLTQINEGREGYNGADMVLRRDGRTLEFGHLAKPGAEYGWQGRPHDFIGFDEGAQLSGAKVQFVLGWLRTTTVGQRCRAIIASNPPIGGEGEWLIGWFAPWLDPMFPRPAKPGDLRWAITVGVETEWVDGPGVYERKGERYEALSRTFIPASLDDNPYLRETGYRAQLANLPEPLRSQLLHGDFLAGREDHAWQVIPSAWVQAAQARWRPERPLDAVMTSVGVDVAQGGSARTVIAPLWGSWFAEPTVLAGDTTPNGPSVAGQVVSAMRGRCLVALDLTGGWGISARDQLLDRGIECVGVVFSAGTQARTRDGKLGFANVRSEMLWRLREALDPEGGEVVALPPGRGVLAELTAARWEPRKDKILVEPKEDIVERLGASPDIADALMMAWRYRGEGMRWLASLDDEDNGARYLKDRTRSTVTGY